MIDRGNTRLLLPALREGHVDVVKDENDYVVDLVTDTFISVWDAKEINIRTTK